jgi:hypothetical protein
MAGLLKTEKTAVAELERSYAAEMRSVQTAAKKNFNEQHAAISQAWEAVEKERSILRGETAELQRLGRELDLRDLTEKERIKTLLENERGKIDNEWLKIKEQQRDCQQQQQLLENQLALIEMGQQKLDTLDHQRKLCVSLQPLHCSRQPHIVLFFSSDFWATSLGTSRMHA